MCTLNMKQPTFPANLNRTRWLTDRARHTCLWAARTCSHSGSTIASMRARLVCQLHCAYQGAKPRRISHACSCSLRLPTSRVPSCRLICHPLSLPLPETTTPPRRSRHLPLLVRPLATTSRLMKVRVANDMRRLRMTDEYQREVEAEQRGEAARYDHVVFMVYAFFSHMEYYS